MKLIVVRHSQTIEAKEWHEKVEYRPLSKTGIVRSEILGKILEKKYKHSFEYIFSSEYKRSIQTAEILRRYLKPFRFIITETLNPEKDPKEFLDFLLKTPDTKRYILAVGHHPFLERLISIITGKSMEKFYFKKPSMCEIEFEEIGKGEMIYFHNFDDIADGIKIPIKKSEPHHEEIEEIELL